MYDSLQAMDKDVRIQEHFLPCMSAIQVLLIDNLLVHDSPRVLPGRRRGVWDTKAAEVSGSAVGTFAYDMLHKKLAQPMLERFGFAVAPKLLQSCACLPDTLA